MKAFKKQGQAVSETDLKFRVIVEDMDHIIEKVDVAFKLIESLGSIHQEAVDATSSIAAIAMESAASVQEVFALGENQKNEADRLSQMSLGLAEVILYLEKNIKTFIIEEGV